MDVSIRIFLDPEEYIRFLEFASSEGGSIVYRPRHDAPFRRVAPGAPLPEDLTGALRAPLETGAPHLVHIGVGVDDAASDPKQMNPQRTITAYFGGVDGRALYLSPISARSEDKETIAFARRLKKWLTSNAAAAGVEVFGEPVEPGDEGTLDRNVHYTEGARGAARSGLQLRQRGVANIRYVIPEGGSEPAPKPAARGKKR